MRLARLRSGVVPYLLMWAVMACGDGATRSPDDRELDDDRDVNGSEGTGAARDAAPSGTRRDGGTDAATSSVRDAASTRDEPARPLDAAASVDAQTSPRDGAGDAPADAKLPGRFPPSSDPSAPGPYKTKTVMATGPNGNYTIYHPEPLGPDGLKHPVLTWGNGGGTQPGLYPMLPHLATHGFVVVAANTIPSPGGEEQLGKDMLAGVDWILTEERRQGSPYFGKLDATRLAAFGYSMGGLGTFTIAGDTRWSTTVHISGGNMGATVSRIAMLRGPALFLCGENDIANPNCAADFDAVTTQAVLYAVMKGEDHLGILFGDWASRIRGTVTAWLRRYVMADANFAPMFEGADCGLCNDANYVVKKKNFD